VTGPARRWVVAMAALGLLALAIRVHNAIDYPLDKGFDAVANWEYVELLSEQWLPAPDAGWSTAHPPLFYWLVEGARVALGGGEKAGAIHAARAINGVLGLAMAALAVGLVLRTEPENLRRAFLASILVLFLPVHIYTSAMLSEEILVATLVSCVVVCVARDLSTSEPHSGSLRVAGIGAIAGLAVLTKLSGLLVIGAGGLAYAIDGFFRGRPGQGLGRVAILVAAALLVGGWFYAHNWFEYGYIYPHRLNAHAVMGTMPPGARTLTDYLRVPLATFTDPRMLSPDLLHSVWGTTYVTLWFDGHRHFLPRSDAEVLDVGRTLVALGILPMLAFAWGVVRAVGRLRAGINGTDPILLSLLALTLVGFVGFTWRNPWFATVKATHLLGLTIPFAFYASDALAAWTRPDRWSRVPVWIAVGLLIFTTTIVFTHGLAFVKADDPGMQWLLTPR
jgi:hypothetical protein